MHCSAGIGRTGTIILIDVILRRLFRCKEVNVSSDALFRQYSVFTTQKKLPKFSNQIEFQLADLFRKLRNQRASCIQSEEQYVFIVLSVLDYIQTKCPKFKDKVNKYKEDFKAAMLPPQTN
ncbi:unnamed protein product [Haemonchus placei]|uniref:TYR_PHOSPHATASE_2 domain-containing protein n=1 Tax=Haemonchus placei TaxID=6290 RepID=A0A0N4WX27_HAEPC|nr:unnamed protein product [Haemonchus placei]